MNCPECGAPVLLAGDRAELVCSGCQLVVGQGLVSLGPEDSGAGSGGRGPALSSPNAVTMSTTPTSTSRDASGRLLDPASAQRMGYLSTIDGRVVSRRDRSERRLYDATHDIAMRAKVSPETEERLFHVARRAVDARAFPGWNFSLVAAGSLYFVLQERDGYVRAGDVVRLVSGPRSRKAGPHLMVAYRRIVRVLGAAPRHAAPLDIALDVVERLDLDRRVVGVLRKAAEGMPASGRPKIDAAALLYKSCLAAGIAISQRAVAESCGTSDVSLRSRLAKGE